MAHELCHGAFGLEHIFEYGVAKGTMPRNLMDYTDKTLAERFPDKYFQWYNIENPKDYHFPFTDSAEDGESVFVDKLVEILKRLIDNKKDIVLTYFNNEDFFWEELEKHLLKEIEELSLAFEKDDRLIADILGGYIYKREEYAKKLKAAQVFVKDCYDLHDVLMQIKDATHEVIKEEVINNLTKLLRDNVKKMPEKKAKEAAEKMAEEAEKLSKLIADKWRNFIKSVCPNEDYLAWKDIEKKLEGIEKLVVDKFDDFFANALVQFAECLFEGVDQLEEEKKSHYFETDANKTAAILLYEFARGTGFDKRIFYYDGKNDKSFANQFLSGRVMNEFIMKLLFKCNTKTYNEFLNKGLTFGLTFSPDHTIGEVKEVTFKTNDIDAFGELIKDISTKNGQNIFDALSEAKESVIKNLKDFVYKCEYAIIEGTRLSIDKHLTSNLTQFFIGGANVTVKHSKDNEAIAVIENRTSRSSLMLHIVDNYNRGEEGHGPLTTIVQEIEIKIPLNKYLFKDE